jgi:centromeric protein E
MTFIRFISRVAYIEIYNEKVYDLFSDKNDDLKIHENINGDVYVQSKEFICKSQDQILKHFDDGSKARKVAETNMNDRSSRSHTIFRIVSESNVFGIISTTILFFAF